MPDWSFIQPFMSIEVDPDREWVPCGSTYMHEADVTDNEIEIQIQPLGLSVYQI